MAQETPARESPPPTTSPRKGPREPSREGVREMPPPVAPAQLQVTVYVAVEIDGLRHRLETSCAAEGAAAAVEKLLTKLPGRVTQDGRRVEANQGDAHGA